jgi:hypothetical protein
MNKHPSFSAGLHTIHEQEGAAAQDLKELGFWVCFRGCRRQSREAVLPQFFFYSNVLPQLVPVQVCVRRNSEGADAIEAVLCSITSVGCRAATWTVLFMDGLWYSFFTQSMV